MSTKHPVTLDVTLATGPSSWRFGDTLIPKRCRDLASQTGQCAYGPKRNYVGVGSCAPDFRRFPGRPASFTKLFEDSYAADNVRMNNVLPGWIDSLPATEERCEAVPM